jgi:hypothetical protein
MYVPALACTTGTTVCTMSATTPRFSTLPACAGGAQGEPGAAGTAALS